MTIFSKNTWFVPVQNPRADLLAALIFIDFEEWRDGSQVMAERTACHFQARQRAKVSDV